MIEIIGPKIVDETEAKFYRFLAQTETGLFTYLSSQPITGAEAVETAKSFDVVSVQGIVIIPVATLQEWTDLRVSFCPRCGSQLDVPQAHSVSIDCEDCGMVGNFTPVATYKEGLPYTSEKKGRNIIQD